MDKNILRAIRRDCHRVMWPCYILCGLVTLLSFLAPTLAARLVGDMTDSLLALDVSAIKSRLPPFFAAIALEAALLPLGKMLRNLVTVRRAGCYQRLLMRRVLCRPLTALHKETGATVAEHIIWHTPYYYSIQISKCTLPATVVIYGAALTYTLSDGKIPAVFAAAVLLLAGLPLARTAALGRLNAKIAALERDYETARAKEDETMYEARCFYRVNGLAESCVRSFRERFISWFQSAGRKKLVLEALRVVLDYLCDYGASLGVIFVGSIPVLSGRMGVGALMTGYLLLPTLTGFFKTIAAQAEDIQKEKDMQSRLTVFYGETAGDLEKAEKEMPASVPAISEIRLDHVTFAYPASECPVLEDRCGRFLRGENIRLTGKNGSGKSTLARLLSGLYAPQAGRVTDENGNSLTKETLRRLVTIEEQDGFVFQGTVWDNLFAGEDLRERAVEMLDELGFEKPLDYAVASGAGNLSPGERHKLLLVRAFLRDSQFLILDEPLNHLDSRGRAFLARRIEDAKEGVILISHRDLLPEDFLNAQISLKICQIVEKSPGGLFRQSDDA